MCNMLCGEGISTENLMMKTYISITGYCINGFEMSVLGGEQTGRTSKWKLVRGSGVCGLCF